MFAPEHYFLVDSAQGRDLALFLGDWWQSEKLFEIKPPLARSELDERRPLPHWRCC